MSKAHSRYGIGGARAGGIGGGMGGANRAVQSARMSNSTRTASASVAKTNKIKKP